MNMRALLGTAIFTTLSAYAQTTQTGPPLQNTPNLDALYGQVLNAYLDAHMIPQADYAEISASLGPDFTAEVYALEMSTLIGIISKAPSDRTPTEVQIIQELGYRLQVGELAMYNSAVANYNSWNVDPCDWRLDPTVASQFGLTYNPYPWCYNGLLSFLVPRSTPNADYYLAVAQEKTYNVQPNVAIATAALRNLASQQQWAAQIPAGVIATATWATVAANINNSAAVALRAANLARFNLAATETAIATTETAATTTEAASGFSLSTASFALGPAVLVEIMAQILVQATIDLVTDLQNQSSVDAMIATDNSLPTTPPDLTTYISDQSPLQRLTSVVATGVGAPAAGQPVEPDSTILFYMYANGTSQISSDLVTTDPTTSIQWTTVPRKSWLQRTAPKAKISSLSAYLEFTGWDGTSYRADREGTVWLVQKLNPASTDTVCLPGTTVTASCSSWTTSALQVKDDRFGNVSVEIVSAPSIQCCSSLAVTPGVPVSFTPSITSGPACSIALSGTLPHGLTVAPNGSISGTVPVDANATGEYADSYRVSCPYANVAAPFQLGVSTAVIINNIPVVSFVPEIPVNIPFTVSGMPTPVITGGSFFATYGLAVQDLGSGNGLITGMAAPANIQQCAGGFGYVPVPGVPACGEIDAYNGILEARQQVTFNEHSSSPAVFGPQTSYTFRAGVPMTYTVRTSGATTKVIITRTDKNYVFPVTWRDNGDGSASLSAGGPAPYQFGMPATSSTTYTLSAHALGSYNGFTSAGNFQLVNNTTNINLTIDNSVFFPGVTPPVYTVGKPVSDTIHANYTNVSIVLDTSLPSGLSFANNTISGTPAAGTGGPYSPAFHASMIFGSNPESKTTYPFEIWEAPSFTAPASYQVYQELGATFTIKPTAGYPQRKTATSPGMAWTGALQVPLPGPAPVQISDNVNGVRTGFATITVPPNQRRTDYPYVVTATNETGSASQLMILHVVQLGDVNGDGVVNCTDVNLIEAAYGAVQDSVNWDYRLDLNGDGIINFGDAKIALFAIRGGSSSGCQ